MSITELQEARERAGMGPDGPDGGPNGGRSIADRAEDFPESDPYAEQEELFVLEQGRRIPFSKLIDRGVSVEYRINLRSKSIVGGADMGLLSFKDPDILLLVPARQGKVEADPTYSEDGEIEKVVVRVNFKPLTVRDSTSPEGRALLGLEEE